MKINYYKLFLIFLLYSCNNNHYFLTITKNEQIKIIKEELNKNLDSKILNYFIILGQAQFHKSSDEIDYISNFITKESEINKNNITIKLNLLDTILNIKSRASNVSLVSFVPYLTINEQSKIVSIEAIVKYSNNKVDTLNDNNIIDAYNELDVPIANYQKKYYKSNDENNTNKKVDNLLNFKAEAKFLYYELLNFKDKEDFHINGFAKSYKYYMWKKRLEDISNSKEADIIFENNGFVVKELYSLALEYKNSNGKETEYTLWIKDHFLDDLEK